MATSPYFYKAFLATNGKPASAGWLYAYVAGSSALKPIYTDVTLTNSAANPLRLDGNGICPQFFTEAGLYDFKVYEYNAVTPLVRGAQCFSAINVEGDPGAGGAANGNLSAFYADFGRVGADNFWQSALARPLDDALRFPANTLMNGTRFVLEQQISLPTDYGAQYQVTFGPNYGINGSPEYPHYLDAVIFDAGWWNTTEGGRLKITMDLIASVAYITCEHIQPGLAKMPYLYNGSIPFDPAEENWLNIMFNPNSSAGSEYLIRRNLFYRFDP